MVERIADSFPDTLPDTKGISDLLASASLETDALGSDEVNSASLNARGLGSAGKSAVLSSFLSALGNIAYGGEHRHSNKLSRRLRTRWVVRWEKKRRTWYLSRIMRCLRN